MAFSGGVFSLASGNPVTTATTISSTWANDTLSDIATGLSTCLLKDGSQTVTANIPMSSFKLTGLAAGSTAGDSVRFEQVYEVLLQTNTPSASTTTPFDNLLTSTYGTYIIELINITVGTDQEAISLQVGTGSGPTYQATNYQYGKVTVAGTGTTAGGESGAAASDNIATQIVMTRLNGNAGAVGNAAGEGLNGYVKLWNPSGASHKRITWQVSYTDSNGNLEYYAGAGFWKDTTAITSVLLKTVTGGTLTGTLKLYGLK